MTRTYAFGAASNMNLGCLTVRLKKDKWWSKENACCSNPRLNCIQMNGQVCETSKKIKRDSMALSKSLPLDKNKNSISVSGSATEFDIFNEQKQKKEEYSYARINKKRDKK